MYIPVLKNRLYEIKFLREHGNLFDQNIIPLVEILNLKIGRTTKTIPEILKEYDNYLKSPYFLDFFTFGHGEYKNFDSNSVDFSINIRNESKYSYKELLMKSIESKFCIPVISIKEIREFLLNPVKIKNLIQSLQNEKQSIAVRITYNLFEEYIDIIDSLLREEDYLFYDINEEKIDAYFFDILIIKDLKEKYHKIIIHSPRLAKLNNNSYPNGYFTKLIDNELRDNYKDYGFSGFSDYAGLKNVLPTKGSNGMGAALGLFYLNSKNQFFSIKNLDTSKGASGHFYVIEELFNKYKNILDPFDNCPAFNYINNTLKLRNKSGAWGQWKYITILRYISQIKQST